jgi:coenzyme F420-reducing hydrogenase delta subunit
MIEEVNSSQSFIIKDWNEIADNLFIYGKKVSDFRAIDFDQITALSVSAIQELSKQVDKLKLENEKLNKQIQKNQADFEKRLKLLESKIK